MKKVAIFICFVLFTNVGMSQTGFYLGYENGLKFDKFFYVNSKGYSLTLMPADGLFGAYVGYKLKSYTFETGFYGYYTSSPFVGYDYSTGIPSTTSSSSGSSDMDNWVIPFRFGKEFLFAKNQVFVKPEISLLIYIARDYSSTQPIGSWGDNASHFPGDTSHISSSTDSTVAYGYRTNKVNFGIGTAVSVGYRFKEKADIYLKGNYDASFSPLYYDTITHYSSDDIVYATSTFAGNSFALQIGVRYYFAKRKRS